MLVLRLVLLEKQHLIGRRLLLQRWQSENRLGRFLNRQEPRQHLESEQTSQDASTHHYFGKDSVILGLDVNSSLVGFLDRNLSVEMGREKGKMYNLKKHVSRGE